MLFRSTNRQSSEVDFSEALLRGQAPDYGLYMPVKMPVISKKEISAFDRMDYPHIACTIMKKFLGEDIPRELLGKMAVSAYNFDVPVQYVRDNLYILWLTKGPTASFKDFAARMMAQLMQYFASRESRKLTVLVATSGDTGGAVANAFHRLDNTNVVVLFPFREVTERQRKQMTTLGDNVFPVAVKGKFDDCQAIVKRAFNDSELECLGLTSANSINFGRLMPQIVYYFYAYSRLKKDEVVFSVPSGNFGNIMGGVFAKKMGLPVKKFIAAVNENDEFPEFMETGVYKPVVPSRECSSNAMNVGHPSNLSRLMDIYGGWLTDERDEIGTVLKKGVLKIQPDMKKMRTDFSSYSVTEKEVDETITAYFKNCGILIEPHGAVGIRAAEKDDCSSPVVCIETADPAKFPEKIRALLNLEPPLPFSLSGLDGVREDFATMESDYAEFKNLLRKKFPR
ncbi:MAG: threonine synthase [Candidatus Omnitrophica bacterium]|nr:threonine synthase [Candidatus Omnitrophota bacterium]